MAMINQAAAGKPVHQTPMTAGAPAPGGRQLNATESFDIGGPAQAIMGRVGQFAKGASSSRPGGGLPGVGGAGGLAGAAGAGEAAGGIGELAAEVAPLALA